MSAYILTHSPTLKPDYLETPENPAQEIVDNIRKERVLTAFGGWSITVSAMEIKPGNLLFFYRTKQGRGIFAVGRALSPTDSECCELRAAKYRKEGKSDNFVPLGDGLAAYRAADWKKKKDEEGKETFHINAKWEIVADPGKELDLAVLVSHNFKEIAIRNIGIHDIADPELPFMTDLSPLFTRSA